MPVRTMAVQTPTEPDVPALPYVRPSLEIDRDNAAALIRHIRGLCVELEACLGLAPADLPLIRIPGRYSPLKAAIGQILTERGPLSTSAIVEILTRRGQKFSSYHSVSQCVSRNFVKVPGHPVSRWALP